MNAIQKYKKNTVDIIKNTAWESLSPATQKSYQHDYDLFFRYINKSVDEVTSNDILSYIRSLEGKFKPATINRKIAALSKMFSVLKIAGEIKDNPVEILKTFKKINFHVAHDVHINLTLDDIRRATKYKNTEPIQHIRMCVIVKMLAQTGLRISEMINIKNSDISSYTDINKKIDITGKGRKGRTIFLPVKFIKEIKKAFPDTDKTDYLFYNQSHKIYNRIVVWNQLKRFFEDTIGKEGIHPHTLRHFFITHKISTEGQDIKAVSRYVGHSDVKTTLNMYVDTALDDKDAGIKI